MILIKKSNMVLKEYNNYMRRHNFLLLKNSIKNSKLDQIMIKRYQDLIDFEFEDDDNSFISLIKTLRKKHDKKTLDYENIANLVNMFLNISEISTKNEESLVKYIIATFLYIGSFISLENAIVDLINSKNFSEKIYLTICDCLDIIENYFLVNNNRIRYRRIKFIKKKIHLESLTETYLNSDDDKNSNISRLKDIYFRLTNETFENDLDEKYIQLSDEYVFYANRILGRISVEEYSIVLRYNMEIADKCLISNLYHFSRFASEKDVIYSKEIVSDLVKHTRNPRLIKIRKLIKDDVTLDSEIENIFKYIDAIGHIESIKNNLLVINYEHDLAFYTSMKTLKFIISQENKKPVINDEFDYEGSDIAFMHYSYMNDPKEGKVLLEFLNYYSEENNINYPYVFMKCFTPRVDQIPMWEMYGDHAKGCCLIIDFKKLFKTYYRKIYRVCYIDSEGKINDNNESTVITKKNINVENSLMALKKLFSQTNNSSFFIELLSDIRFLFKNKEYSYENEIRIIYSESENYGRFKFTDEDFPKMYIKPNVNLYIKKVIVGPKCNNINQIIPYLQYRFYQINKDNDMEEKVEIVKSDVHYR